ATLLEGVVLLRVSAHLEVRTEQEHHTEAEVMNEAQCREHHAAAALDAERVFLVGRVAPVDLRLVEEGVRIEVRVSRVEEHGRHVTYKELARPEPATTGPPGIAIGFRGGRGFREFRGRLLHAQASVTVIERHELDDAGVLPADVEEASR